jgi:hypothetical protein
MKHTFSFLLACLVLLAMTSACKKDEDCPTGFQGSDCNQQITPSKIIVNAVRVTKFPALDPGGASWDVADGPDIYFQMYTDADGIIYDQPTFFEDADASQDFDLTVTPPIEILNPTGEYGIQLLDYDDGVTSDDFMGGIIFIPYNSTNGFPTTLTVDGTLVTFVLELTYEF